MISTRPRILYVTTNCPCGPSFGGRIRAYNVGRLLQRIGHVSLVLTPSTAIPQEDLELTEQSFEIRGIFPLNMFRKNLLDRFRMELDPTYSGIRGQRISEENRKLFNLLYQEHDLVWFHTVRPPDAFNTYSWRKSVLDIDDLQSQVYATEAAVAPSVFRRLLDLRMKYLWRRREKHFLDRFNIVCICSNQDRKLFNDDERSYVVGNGYELTEPTARKNTTLPVGNRIGFIGLLDYMPNLQGISWFIKSVWPIVKKNVPDARLRLIGKNTDGEISSHGVDIDGLGWVADAGNEIDSWSAMIVPIQQGGGTRIKIAEAFARRCPVISTHLGAYGYNLENGKEAILTDDPSDFAQACIDLMRNPGHRESMTESAFQKYLRYHTWEAQAAAIAKAVKHCLDLQNT